MRTNCPMRGKTELKERKANWAYQGEPRSQKKARLPRKGRGGEERAFKLRNRKRTMWSIKRVENLAESAILVGEKPTEATVSGITKITPVKSLSRPAELQSQNKRILRIKKD